jgi:hypothetical protein
VVLLRSVDASINAPLSYFAGFEWGTTGGMGNAAVNTPGLTGYTNLSIASGSARNGGYGLQVATVAASGSANFPSYTAKGGAAGFNTRVVSATGSVVVASLDTAGGTAISLHVMYDGSTNKFGLQWGSYTPSWQSGTTALNTWVWIDIRARIDSSLWHADWTLETGTNTYTAQPSPADLTGASATSLSLRLGPVTPITQTATIDLDDAVFSQYAAAYPLTPHVVRLLVPETTGASVSGTAANFNSFTANGTLAAFASTNGALLDEVPPTVSASSDGVVQVTAAASDYMNFPMTTYTATSSEIIAGVRALASLWGGTGSGTGTLGFRGYDGTTETTFVAASTSFDPDSLTAVSATYPLWYSATWNPGTKWTQTALDAAALRVGFSTDATPDMGVSALYLEVVTKATPVVRQITSGEADQFTVDLRIDPDNSASVSYLLTSTDATRGATFNYSVSGTPQTPVYVAASSTQEVVVNAAAFGDISIEGFEPDGV